jgi:hypothetical protein
MQTILNELAAIIPVNGTGVLRPTKSSRLTARDSEFVMKSIAVPTGTAATHAAPGLRAALSDFCRALVRDLLNHYRPEKHYMRGPGPKWRERHGPDRTLERAMIPPDDR